MSNKNDLEDELYILLASMKEYRESIKDDKKRLETFYKHVATGVLDEAKKMLQETNTRADRALKSRLDDIETATNRLNLKFIIIYSSTFIVFVMAFLLAIFLYIPSLDEIQQRRADIAVLEKYPIQIREYDDKTLVRIMTKQCYSFQPSNVKEKTYDWCQIDPKKY